MADAIPMSPETLSRAMAMSAKREVTKERNRITALIAHEAEELARSGDRATASYLSDLVIKIVESAPEPTAANPVAIGRVTPSDEPVPTWEDEVEQVSRAGTPEPEQTNGGYRERNDEEAERLLLAARSAPQHLARFRRF